MSGGLTAAGRQTVVECLEQLADLGFQRRVWLRGEGPEVSSPSECVCQLFDDSGLGDMLERGQVTAISASADAALAALASLLEDVDLTMPIGHLLSTPLWAQVRRSAQAARHHIE